MEKEIERILIEWEGKTISSNEHFQNELKKTLEQFTKTIEDKLCKEFDRIELNDDDTTMEKWRNYKFIRNTIRDTIAKNI